MDMTKGAHRGDCVGRKSETVRGYVIADACANCGAPVGIPCAVHMGNPEGYAAGLALAESVAAGVNPLTVDHTIMCIVGGDPDLPCDCAELPK